MSKFGERLNKLRQDHGLTQQELANLFHISNSTISSYETGTRIPDIVFLEDLSKYFHVSTDFLIGLSDSPLHTDVLDCPMIENVNYLTIIEKIQRLPSERKRTLLSIINDLYFCSVIEEKALSIDIEKAENE